MAFQKSIIYFMSGTGNSYRAACRLDGLCRAAGMESRIVPVDAAKPHEEIEASPGSLVVLAFPTHGLMPPWSVIKFIFSLPRKRGARIFCLPTRGCFHIGPVPIPGASGLAQFLPHLVLLFKGYRPRGSVSLDMPINITSLHPGITEGGIARIRERAEHKLARHAKRLLAGKGVWLTRNNLWEALWAIIPLYYIPLYPILYLLIGRLFMGKMMFANNNCTACGLCVRSCPNSAVVLKGKDPARPFWRYNCEDCLRCLNYCPSRAVEAGTSWAGLIILIGLVPFTALLSGALASCLPLPSLFGDYRFRELADALFFIPAVIAAYALFWRLVRIRPVNALFSYTSLTRYFSRYHEPGTKLGDMMKRRRETTDL